ncbi:helix-turn-helix domain-containing protein [Sorangium sp. So ce1099]|uniref:helix-turn-helix domain-containing protein n=1 Tax=Sorangium sp. So ce1099 TaxID=3133331 RepID=UPI003F61A4E4
MAEIDLNDVAVFVRVVDRAGFTKVARELGVPTSTVSRTIARLEAALGPRARARPARSRVARRVAVLRPPRRAQRARKGRRLPRFCS